VKTTCSVAVFHVHDFEAALTYYRDILGFEPDFKHERYAGLKMGEGGFLHLTALGTRPAGMGSAYFFCDEVDGYYEEIRQKGALLRNQPQDYPYGMRDFTVADHDGNNLTFGRPTGASPEGK